MSVFTTLAMLATILATGFTTFSPFTLGYRPFLDPLPFESDWLLLPLLIAIAIVYKTIKLENLARLPREAGILTAQITIFMILAAAALWLLVEVV